MNYEAVVEKLMNYYSSDKFADEVAEARREFFDRAGILDETTPDFEQKLAQFVDWYLFSRPLKKSGQTPVSSALKGHSPLGPDEFPALESMTQTIHSLFEFQKVKGDDVYIRDIFTGQKHVIKKSPISMGFTKDQLFEARLIPSGDTFQFSHAFCFHPAEVTKIIMSEVKKVKKMGPEDAAAAKEALLVKLFKLRYKHEQYKHLNVREIYSPDSKLRI